MKVRFTFSKLDGTLISLDYKPFKQPHSDLWFKGIISFVESNQLLTDVNRVYNFNDYEPEFNSMLQNCNDIIYQLNHIYNLNMQEIDKNNLQEIVNKVHVNFVESNRQMDSNQLWVKLNDYLHGLEIIQRSKNKPTQGQVFCTLPNSVKYDIPDTSYSFFTTKKHYGYCYANYPHVGRHILEMFNAQDEDAMDEDILPQSKIAGDFYLWFGNNTPDEFDNYRMNKIKEWYYLNNIEEKSKLPWGNKHLAIGWLPVAELDKKITRENLVGLNKLEKIEII